MKTYILLLLIMLSFIGCKKTKKSSLQKESSNQIVVGHIDSLYSEMLGESRKLWIHTTTHFEIFYTELDDKNIKEIADSLEANYSRIVTHLQSEKLPVVKINFYSNITSLQIAVQSIEPNLPIWAIGLATSVSQIHLLSPNHPKQDFRTMIHNTIHEFAHCVSYNINSNIANNPRWLWEAVAIYESNHYPEPQKISYLVNQNPPSLNELNQFTNTYIYEVGFFIAEFIVETKGNIGLNELIKNNGDLKKTMNLNEEEFTKQWFLYVKKKYGI